MPDRIFDYHPEAIEEARQAFQWYAERSESAAEGFWQELRRARQSATERPHAGSPYSYGTKYRRLKRYPYALVYIERGDLIIGIAVAHLRRKPGYWKTRLSN